MFGIVVALKSECKYLIESLHDKKSIKLADKECYLCTINGHECVLAISGIGKVSAGLTTQLLIDKFNVDFILNFGTCGGMNNSIKILDYYAVENCCQFDFDLREIDNVPLGYIQEYDTAYFKCETIGLEFLNKSNLATADRFTNALSDINTINEIGCSLRDMEGGAIAQVCTSNNVRVYMIKGISDVHGNQTAQEQFYKNLSCVAQGFPAVINRAIYEIYLANNNDNNE